MKKTEERGEQQYSGKEDNKMYDFGKLGKWSKDTLLAQVRPNAPCWYWECSGISLLYDRLKRDINKKDDIVLIVESVVYNLALKDDYKKHTKIMDELCKNKKMEDWRSEGLWW